MDYLIADNNLILKKNEKFYSEKIIYMPDCYQPHDTNKKINKNYDKKKYNLPEGKFIYCCLNGTYKITPKIFDCWMNILIRTNNTVSSIIIFTSSYDLIQSIGSGSGKLTNQITHS